MGVPRAEGPEAATQTSVDRTGQEACASMQARDTTWAWAERASPTFPQLKDRFPCGRWKTLEASDQRRDRVYLIFLAGGWWLELLRIIVVFLMSKQWVLY